MVFRMARLKRRVSGAWGSRITIPKDVRPDYQGLYNKSVEEIFHAPPDYPPQRAHALFLQWQGDIKNRIATLRANQRGDGHDLTRRDAHALAGEWYRWFVGQHEDNPGEARHWSKLREVLWLLLEDAAGDPETHEIDLEAPEVRDEIHPRLTDEAKITQFLINKGEVLTPTAMTLFLDAVLHEFLTATELLERRAQRDYSPDQHLRTLPEYRGKTAPTIAPRSGKSAMQLFEAHIPAANLAAGTIKRRRPVFIALDAYLAGRDFDALSEEEAQRWITSLTTERAASTIKKIYLTPLKAVGRWAVKQRLITRNPFEECVVTLPKRVRHRETKAFIPEEIRLILSSANAIRNTKRPGMAARRWVTWICAYTGARAGEITQLRGQDVKERDGIKAIWITPEAGSVKTGEPRWVPIHEHLIAQGFLDYVKWKGKGPLFYKPARTTSITAPVDITNPKDPPAVIMRNVLGRWIRKIGITDKEVGPTHGWRHAFKQIADRHGISDRVSDAITGHAPPTEGRKYGAPTLEDMAKALEKFPRYKIEG
jgi:integrase